MLPSEIDSSVEIIVSEQHVDIDVNPHENTVEINVEAPEETVVEITAPGPQGRPGIQGPKGDKGDHGNPLTILGSLPEGTLPEHFPPGYPEPGDAWIVGHDIYVFDGTQFVSSLRGPTGAQGPQGIQGPVGPIGPSVDPATVGQTFFISEPSEIWEVSHSLPYRPSVETFTNDGEEIDADVIHLPGLVRITHGFAMSGSVRLT